MKMNMNDKRRHEIVGLDFSDEKYDLKRIDNITADKLQILIDEKFADPTDCQNSAPSIADILEFLKANKGFSAHGYIITPKRNDYRVSLEGVDKRGDISVEDRQAFTDMFRMADEFTCDSNSCHCWYD